MMGSVAHAAYNYRTEQYVHCVRRYVLFHQKCHPREMGAAEVEAFACQWPTVIGPVQNSVCEAGFTPSHR